VTTPFVPPTRAEVLALREASERRLSAEELDAYVNAPWSEEEREDTQALIRWFQRRYPTPLARLRAARVAYRRARARMPPSGAT
jgi:hypothetical protein